MNSVAVEDKLRIRSIDLLRGTVMIIMALDHVRDFFHSQAMISDPLNLQTTTPILFFTRWVTHFCAPVFVFLSGVSAYLSGRRKTKRQLSSFLLKRGFWLVCVEIVLMSFVLTFNPLYNMIFLQVIWAIGVSMIMLALLAWLPFPALLAVGLIICFGHNLLDYAPLSDQDKKGLWWLLLHSQGAFALSKTHLLLVTYAFLPWSGVMICGYCFGRLITMDAQLRVKRCIYTGLVLIVLFVILRSINVYGDPSHWSVQRNSFYSLLSFLNVTKYPPSLLFMLLMLGPGIVVLGLLEKAQNGLTNIVNIYGRVPFFYFIVHFFLIHVLCVIAFYLTGYTNKDIVNAASPFLFRPPEFGFSLTLVYAIWLLVIIIMYPACRWYNRYKTTHQHWWLSYL